VTSDARRWATAAGGLATALLLSGCGGLSDDEVGRVAEDFAGGDAAARCDLLAPGAFAALVEAESSSCEEAIEQLPVGSGAVTEVQVWGEEAQARLSDDTLFLTRTSSGWRVMAAACRPQGQDEPYDCQVETA
jgi:hypothetical protein